jgi:hypothetical protein
MAAISACSKRGWAGSASECSPHEQIQGFAAIGPVRAASDAASKHKIDSAERETAHVEDAWRAKWPRSARNDHAVNIAGH